MLVADQGGEIDIETQVGKGTTFTVRLRTAKNPEETADAGR
jgi:signal transduction histidine kinase